MVHPLKWPRWVKKAPQARNFCEITTFFNYFSLILRILKTQLFPWPTHLKPESGFGPSSQVTFSKSSEIIDFDIRNTCLNVCKTFLESFRDRRHVSCCKNTVYKHDFTSESIGKTSKLSDFDQFLPCDSVYTKMTSLGIPKIHKPTPEMERSRPVDSSRYQTFCLTPSGQKVIDQNILTFF